MIRNISRTVKIGDTDISPYIEWGPQRTKGAGRRVKTSPIIGGNRAVVWQEGRDPLTLEAGLIFRPDLADQIGDEDEITALIDDLAGDQETDRLYFGRADRFAVVHGSVGDTEIAPAAGGGGIVRKTAEFWSEAAELYGATAYTGTCYNYGNIIAPLYSATITGGTSIVLKIGDESIDLSRALFSDEVMTLDRFGQISQAYSDNFAAGTKFAADKYSSSFASVSEGVLVILTSGYVTYKLQGSWPLKRGGLLVTFTPIVSGTGEAFFEASIDQGGSWLEVSNNSRWVDGAENKIYVPQAEGYVEVYIRWRCDGDITFLSIDNLTISQERAVPWSAVPKAPLTELVTAVVTGATTASTVWRNRYKP